MFFIIFYITCSVEKCECPEGYSGLSCETCEVGYFQSRYDQFGSIVCEKCDCNGHAPTCNPLNGDCETMGTDLTDEEICEKYGDKLGDACDSIG